MIVFHGTVNPEKLMDWDDPTDAVALTVVELAKAIDWTCSFVSTWPPAVTVVNCVTLTLIGAKCTDGIATEGVPEPANAEPHDMATRAPTKSNRRIRGSPSKSSGEGLSSLPRISYRALVDPG